MIEKTKVWFSIDFWIFYIATETEAKMLIWQYQTCDNQTKLHRACNRFEIDLPLACRKWILIWMKKKRNKSNRHIKIDESKKLARFFVHAIRRSLIKCTLFNWNRFESNVCLKISIPVYTIAASWESNPEKPTHANTEMYYRDIIWWWLSSDNLVPFYWRRKQQQ